MKKKVLEKTNGENKKKYESPNLKIEFVEMEGGIAVASASVAPATVGGNVDSVSTDWAGTDDTTVNTVF